VLPFSDVTVLHLDAHPDLLAPNDLLAQDVYSKHTLYDSVSIATWLMPLLYAGHVTTVVWVKPPWADQIEDGTYSFWVGQCATTGLIRVSCPLSYFLSEALYQPEDLLQNKKRVTLITVTLRPALWASTEEGKTQTSTTTTTTVTAETTPTLSTPTLSTPPLSTPTL
ncbi:hypothetical protein Ahia01_001326100, partial [Argonauta hians]